MAAQRAGWSFPQGTSSPQALRCLRGASALTNKMKQAEAEARQEG